MVTRRCVDVVSAVSHVMVAVCVFGLGATLGGYVTWSTALRSLEPSRAMSYLYCVPPLAVAIGALFLHESVTLWLLLGGAAADPRSRPRVTTMASASLC